MSGERLLYPDWPQGGIDRPTVCKEKSLCRQSDFEGSDINAIMKRFEKTGVLPLDTREALFTDVSAIGSYRDALEVMQRAQEGFLALPPGIRERFGNDPVAFLDFTSDPRNMAELTAMGVLAAPEGAPVVAEGAAAAAPVAQ